MSEKTMHEPVAIPEDRAENLLAMAARAPSVLNSQPWLFRVGKYTIELFADTRRKLRADPVGREMLISCGTALFGLRLGIRSLGYQPVVQLLPDADRPRLLARVRLGAPAELTELERQMIDALPRRHTHRGPFSPGQLPPGLLIGLQHDAVNENATLALIKAGTPYEQLAAIVGQATRTLNYDTRLRADVRTWVRAPGSTARDGIPAAAFAAKSVYQPGRLAQRDLDLGRGYGMLSAGGPPASATAILLTQGDTRADWMRAGQALHRVLAHAATSWVFASLHTQPLEANVVRTLIRSRLALPGAPQMMLQFGPSQTTWSTARRSPGELIAPGR